MSTISSLLSLAARHYGDGDDPAAEAVCWRIIGDQPRHFDALHLLGVLLTRQDRPNEAIPILRRALVEQPAHRQARLNLGNALLATKRSDEALLVSDDQTPESLNNRGLALRNLQRLPEAAAAFQQAVTIAPNFSPSWFNLATTLRGLNRWQDALDAARTARSRAASNTPLSRLAAITNEIGRILMTLGRHEDALLEYETFLRRHPDEPSVAWSAGLTLLALGRMPEGWRLYERRFDVPDHDRRPEDTVVLDPAAVAGKRVLIHAEQGRGDMLQFIRYAPLLAKRGAVVSVRAYADLVPLLSVMPALNQVVSTDGPLPEADLQTMLMSLPVAFDTTLETIPATVPYLHAPIDRRSFWAETLGARQKPRLGFAWSGSPQSHDRSAVPAALIDSLVRNPSFECHCLQRDITAPDAAWLGGTQPPIRLHQDRLRDFADTAALIEQMDLIITIDTAIAHLAGALAKPAWILLPCNPDFRWLLDRTDSPWYPTARLFRQPAPGAWTDVIEVVNRALGRLAASR